MEKRDSLGRRRHPNQSAGLNGLPAQGDGGADLKCPKWLGKIGAAEWQRAVNELRKLGILSSKDGAALELYAGAFEEYRLARADVLEHGIQVTTKTERGHDVQRKNPSVTVMNSAWSRCRSLVHELGMTPRSKIDGDEEKDDFEALMKLS